MESKNRPTLYVEGTTDQYVLLSLLATFGHRLEKETGPVFLVDLKGLDNLLKALPGNVVNATSSPVGFVVDADENLDNRWQSIRDRIIRYVPDLPQVFPATGLIRNVPDRDHPIGIWLMPDCQTSPGQLEDFLETMIPPDSNLYAYAMHCALEARNSRGAKFGKNKMKKASLATWLAWQQEPGVPYGKAIDRGWLDPKLPLAEPTSRAFVAWFCKLYNLPPPPGMPANP